MASRRPDPDALLQRLREEEGARSRGRLRIFFGASPGVGKTYAMLEAARREKAAGVDVVAGWVETHGRAETTALLEGIPQLPAREVDYRGVHLREFDLDGALARRPALLLLDELAHSNAPGSRHLKRWQDARELLEAGIDVWSTLNVQHLASVADLVAQVTEAPVREIVPDSVMDEADTVEFVDLPPDDLLERLREGKVYVPDVARRAARNFFRKGNLIALRELALRRTAERVEEDVRDYHRAHEVPRAWPVAERILVCIRPNPETARLVQAGRRLAGRLHAAWVVAHVETRAQPALSPEERQTLASAFKLAEDLGAETTVLRGETVSEALLHYARAHSVSKIVVGKPARPRWRDRLFGSPVDAMVRATAEIDVFVVSGAEEGAGEASRRPRPRRRGARRGHLWAVLLTALSTAVCWVLGKEIDRSNLIMVYLLGVVFVATRYGRWPAVTSALLAVAAFDFFFVPPHLTFAVSDTQYVVTFAVMLLVALLISGLAARAVEQAEAAHQRGRRTQLLYAASRELSALSDPAAIARAGERRSPGPGPARAGGRRLGPPARETRGPRHGHPLRGGGALPPAPRQRGPGGRAGGAAGRGPPSPGPHADGLAGDAGASHRRPAGARPPGLRRADRAGGRGGRAPAQHAPQLRVARPAHAAGGDHGRRLQPDGGARPGSGGAPRPGADDP